MAQGLRPHWHQYYDHSIKKYYDEEKGFMLKKIMFRCMICVKVYHERYEYKPPPRKQKSCKVLEKNRKRYSNHN